MHDPQRSWFQIEFSEKRRGFARHPRSWGPRTAQTPWAGGARGSWDRSSWEIERRKSCPPGNRCWKRGCSASFVDPLDRFQRHQFTEILWGFHQLWGKLCCPWTAGLFDSGTRESSISDEFQTKAAIVLRDCNDRALSSRAQYRGQSNLAEKYLYSSCGWWAPSSFVNRISRHRLDQQNIFILLYCQLHSFADSGDAASASRSYMSEILNTIIHDNRNLIARH